MPLLPPTMMDRVDFELCLDVDQYGPTPHQQPGDVNITRTEANNVHEMAFRPRRTRTYSEIEDENTDRSDHDKRPRVMEPHEDNTEEQTHSEGGDGMSEYQCPSQAAAATDPFFSYYGDNIPIIMNPLQAMTAPPAFSIGVPMAGHTGPTTTTQYPTQNELGFHRSEDRRPEGDMTGSNRFIIYEDPDGMEVDTSHIEVSHTWAPRSICVDDDKENIDEEDDDAHDESDIPHQTSRVLLPSANPNSTMETARHIHDLGYGLDDSDYMHAQDSTLDPYRVHHPFRRPWMRGEDAILPRPLSPPSPPRHSRLSDFDADDEADQDVILTNTRHSSSVTAHDQVDMEYLYRRFSTFSQPTEMPVYHPLREIPSMSPVCPEVMARGPRRPRRIRAFDFPL